jgi:predicted aspartyl protease
VNSRFDLNRGLIVIPAEIWGPAGSAVLRFALDTGATGSVVNLGILVALGYDPALVSERVQVTTGSAIEFAVPISLEHIRILGLDRSHYLVLGHSLPPSAGIDGLLGLDFFHGLSLTLDFRNGEITVT